MAGQETQETGKEVYRLMLRVEKKLDRNAPCWCGSGKKYKTCHCDFDERLRQMRREGLEVPPHRIIRNEEQIEGILKSAKVNIAVLDYVAEHIREGISTEEIDRWVYDLTTRMGAIPAPLNYEGYPKSVCTSINEMVCHGIPSPDVILKEGDIINVDCSTILNGYYSDSSRMFIIGETTPEKKKLVEFTRASLEAAVAVVKPWHLLGDIGGVINGMAKENGYQVVRNIGGHGCGIEFHEDPFVSHVARAGTGMVMAPGMTFTIEPMVNMGTHRVHVMGPDGWNVRTEDRKPSAQWEVQVLVTEDGCEILTY